MRCNHFVYKNKRGQYKFVLGSKFDDFTQLNEYWRSVIHQEGEKWYYLVRKEWYELFRCDGRLISQIEATDEPHFGGCSPVMDVRFVCDKCHTEHFGDDLPDSEYKLNEFMQKILDELP